LRDAPAAVVPYLVTRDGFLKRLYHEHTGYWKTDGEGMEVVSAGQWAAVLNLLADGSERPFVRTAETLVGQGDYALALKLADAGLVAYPGSASLGNLRRQALDGLRSTYQSLDPFKFIVYSDLAKADLPPVK
jgi:hypothetical protein